MGFGLVGWLGFGWVGGWVLHDGNYLWPNDGEGTEERAKGEKAKESPSTPRI